MKEVSCRILEMFFRELQKKGLPAARLVDGVGYSVEHVQDKHERIDWVAFVRLMENAREIWSAQELVEMGGAWIDSPFLRHTRLIAGALFTPKQLYRWFDTGVGETSEKRTRRGLGVQMFTCVTNTVTDLGPDRVRLEVVLDEGYPPCPAFFLLTKGGYVELPRLVGKGRALVDMTLIDRGARYDVTLPPGSNRRSIVRRAVRWVAAPMDAARELDETHAALQMRYEQLEAARATLALQATQLRTAHTVNELVQKNLDLDLALATIADALVKEAGFARARLEIDTEVDGLTVLRSIERGQGGATPLERKLEGHGGHRTDRLMGRLIVYPHARADVKEREELLAFIVPSIAMALDNAVSYLVVEEYRRGLELRVAERTAELTKATAALAETVRDLEEAKQMRDRIFANVNHDLRSPLSLVLLSVDEAQNLLGELSPAASRALATVEHGTRRVLRMVDELLLLAEGREGELHISMVVCDLGAMVEAAVEAWKPAARAARITLDHEVEKGVVTRADPNAFERILANLLSNAIKFTPAGAGVQVAFSTTEDRAILEVRDDGPGIEAELRVRLFGRFERGSKARASAIGGSGLGLSLVKALAEAHGGTVSARNAESGGAAFRVELPLSRDDIVATEIMSPKISHRPADYGATETRVDLPSVYEPKGTPRATVLLAEDDPDLRDRTAKVLATEYRVLAAADGIRALELAKLHAPDLLITDIAMPGLDGVELTRRFRALHVNRVAPVLVLTTFGGVHDKLAGFEAGAVDYIHKPFEPSELRARVRSQLALRALALQLLETEKLAALGTLSAGLAHEIRNPANGIVNAVGPLRELLPNEVMAPGTPTAQLLDVVEHCSLQIASLSRELLGFQRGVELTYTMIPIETLLGKVKSTIRHTLEGIELREDLAYRGSVRCAEPLLLRVLTNLLENGAHAAGPGGWIAVRTAIDEASVVVEVTDSGPGVPEELKERIFEPFFTTKPAGKGTGLGLSTAREIVMRHGGNLDVRRSSNRTVFHLEMPRE